MAMFVRTEAPLGGEEPEEVRPGGGPVVSGLALLLLYSQLPEAEAL